jgi:hypothetical protein
MMESMKLMFLLPLILTGFCVGGGDHPLGSNVTGSVGQMHTFGCGRNIVVKLMMLV